MNFFIFGFHRLVWCPKWTPASSSSFIEIETRKHLPFRRIPPARIEPLPFAELEARPGAALSVLLAFLHPRIAGQESFLLQLLAQFGVVLGQRPGDPVADRAGLTGRTAAGDAHVDVELLRRLHREERLLDDHLENVVGEVIVEGTLVDRYRPGAGDQPDARHRCLAAAGG